MSPLARIVRDDVGSEMTDNGTTERCPLGFRCESCGLAGSGLRVTTVDVLGATLCLTLCLGCRESGRAPAIMLSTAEKLVDQHRQHLADFPTRYLRT
jgi:hypothetical protein